MTRILSKLWAFASLALMLSCSDWLSPGRPGEMTFRFNADVYLTRSSEPEIPDTNSFILKIADNSGKTIYDGLYSAVPEPLSLEPGTYNVTACSSDFSKPEFSRPQFGDEQVVVIRSGERTGVNLNCTRMNVGVRLKIASSFLEERPQAVLYLKNSKGKLMYGYRETRIAYFTPGAVSLVMSENGIDNTLLSRNLNAGDILTLGVSASSASSQGNSLRITVDTTGNWMGENFVIGGNGEVGKEQSDPLGVNDARNNAGKSSVWVMGFIVGGDMTSTKVSFLPPFSSQTHLAIAARSSCTDRNLCMSVQLPKGSIRDGLNLVDNPGNIGRKVYLKGDIVESYYGIPGIQNISEFKLE